MSAEACRRSRAEMKLARDRQREADSMAELRFWEGNEVVLYHSGEPMSKKGDLIPQDIVGSNEPVQERASRKDMLLREEEQIDRVRRMLQIGRRLSPQWIQYTLKKAPEMLLDIPELQKSA